MFLVPRSLLSPYVVTFITIGTWNMIPTTALAIENCSCNWRVTTLSVYCMFRLSVWWRRTPKILASSDRHPMYPSSVLCSLTISPNTIIRNCILMMRHEFPRHCSWRILSAVPIRAWFATFYFVRLWIMTRYMHQSNVLAVYHHFHNVILNTIQIMKLHSRIGSTSSESYKLLSWPTWMTIFQNQQTKINISL